MATGGGAATAAKKDDKKDKEEKYEEKVKIKDWSELKKLIKDWQQEFRDQSADFRSLVEEARKRELKLSECRQQLAAFKRRVMAAEHTQKVVDEKIQKIQVSRQIFSC
jgi:chromosome segregation ATPase